MSPDVKSELAPTGVLRAGINLSNFLLVTGKSAAGDPVGVAPDMAGEIAARLGVPVKLCALQDAGRAGGHGGHGCLGHRPDRRGAAARREDRVHGRPMSRSRRRIWCRRARRCKAIADVDRAGVRIAVTGRSAYGLWLDRNIKQAQLVRSDTLDSALEQFVRDKLEALAGLRPRLLSDVTKLPGARILDGQFTAVQQAIGTARKNSAGAAFLRGFVEEAKASGFVASLIERHKVVGLSVAPPA